MEQYINKADIVAEIERKISLFKKEKKTEKWSAGASQMNVVSLGARIAMLEEILSFLDTLEVKEVDLKAELNTWRHNHFHGGRDFEASGEYLERITQLELAKHFFEIGLNSQRKISYVPNIDDSLKELGVDPDSKEAKIFKESYYTALEKLKAQKGK